MGLFSTSASNEAENRAWLLNLKATRPDAYAAYNRLLQLTIASQNDPNEGGSATRAAALRQRQAIGYSPQALEEAKRIVQTQYPDVAAYAIEHGQRTGGLGQGADEIALAALMLVGGASLAGGTSTTAGTAGTTAGTGTVGGTAGTGGTGITAGEAAQAAGTAGSVAGSGGGGGGQSTTGSTVGTGGTGNTTSSGGGFWDSLGNWISSPTGQGLLNLGAGYLQGEQNQQAANTYAQAQLDAAKLAAEEARFRPVGVTTRFGQSQFGYDDKGRLTSAGYTLSPELKAQQDALMGAITGNQGMMQPQNRPIAGARANGGPVAGGQTYLVGENGPELFTAPTSGGIIPNQIGNAIANQGMMYAGGSPGFYSGGQNQAGSIIAQPSPAPAISQPGMVYAGGSPGFYSGGQHQTGSVTTPTTQQPPGGLLGQAVGAQQTTAPMSQGAQSLFNLGQGYLSSTPQEQAARYMQEQQALLSPSRERGLARLQNQMYQQGRTGLAVGATDTMGAANPELEAFYNAQRQQDLALAAQASQGGQQYAQFGAGLLGAGGEMLRGMYGTQTAAYQPYQTALGLTQNLEGMGQNAMDIGINLGARGAASGAQAGQFLQTGASNAAEAQLPANQYSPWVGLLQGAANWY